MAKAPAFKPPKSLAACADLLSDMREKRLAADKVAAALKANEQLLINHIIDTMPVDSGGAVGKHHKVQIKLKTKPVVEDWTKFYAYVKKNGAFDMLQRRLSEEAVLDRIADKKKVDGVGTFIAKSVSLTKV